jgi:hypothetical protein
LDYFEKLMVKTRKIFILLLVAIQFIKWQNILTQTNNHMVVHPQTVINPQKVIHPQTVINPQTVIHPQTVVHPQKIVRLQKVVPQKVLVFTPIYMHNH